MNHSEFDVYMQRAVLDMQETCCAKSADYSSGDDKLYNFQLQAILGGGTPLGVCYVPSFAEVRYSFKTLYRIRCNVSNWGESPSELIGFITEFS